MKLSFGRTLAALAVVVVVAAGIVFLWLQNRQPAPADAKAGDVVVATVNGQKVMRSEVEMMAASLPPQYRQMPMQMIFPALVDQVINTKLLAGEGRKQGLQNDPEVKRRIAMIEDRLVQDAFEQKEIAKQITPEALKARYDKQIAAMPAEEEVNARHILVKTEEEATGIIAALKGGGDFAALAKEKSTDAGSGANGGDLGWFRKTDMVGEFAEAAFKLKKGEVSETPVKTQFGFHVIKLEDRRTAKPPTFEETEEELRTLMERELSTQVLEQMRAKAQIERFNLDGSKVVEEKKPAENKPAENKPADTKPAEKK
ncbi:MAG: parvulin-like peptidyl-prolyl isomerase [Alphaproteobacteria bacterium]|nr:parvulin-like peptidyl-prolyl isomerase [Alphaproteobacteria bacterium]